jgi:HPt (histidine-containing phosphotransfer) domain-containing protein
MDKIDRLAQLKKRYHSSLSGKAMELEEKWQEVTDSQFATTAISELAIYVHQLAGSTGMYGYDRPAQLARDLEGYLREPAPEETGWQQKTSTCVRALVEALAKSPQAT